VYFENPSSSIWIEKGAKRASQVRKSIKSKKVMISVVWSVSGMKSIVMLPIGDSFNKNFFITHVIEDLRKVLEISRPKLLGSGLKIHLDNATPHFANKELSDLSFTRLLHPSYSPDLAPSDFFLFGFHKTKLKGRKFHSEEETFKAVQEILQSVDRQMLQEAYNEWIIRLHRCIERNGEYVEN